jgi:hypothetical protein
MQDAVERLVDQVQRQYEDAHADVSRATEEISRTQQVVSTKTALLASGQQALNLLKPKVDRLQRGSVQTFRKVADELRRHEVSLGLTDVVLPDENNSRKLLTYLEERLAAVEEDAPVENASESIKQFVKKLKRQVRIAASFVCRTYAWALTFLFFVNRRELGEIWGVLAASVSSFRTGMHRALRRMSECSKTHLQS